MAGPSSRPSATQPAPLVDLLGGDDLGGGFNGLSLDAPSPAQPSLQLQPNPSLTPADFQRKWGSLQPAVRLSQPLSRAACALIQPSGQQVTT